MKRCIIEEGMSRHRSAVAVIPVCNIPCRHSIFNRYLNKVITVRETGVAYRCDIRRDRDFCEFTVLEGIVTIGRDRIRNEAEIFDERRIAEQADAYLFRLAHKYKFQIIRRICKRHCCSQIVRGGGKIIFAAVKNDFFKIGTVGKHITIQRKIIFNSIKVDLCQCSTTIECIITDCTYICKVRSCSQACTS